MRENYGDLKKLEKLGKIKKNSFTTEQLLDEQLKNAGGENRIEVISRMEKAFERLISENIGKNIAIVCHGAAIKFLLMKWCTVNEDINLVYNNTVLDITSPCLLKMTFREDELINLEQIK